MKSKIFIITGGQGSGKTTFLANLIEYLRKENILIGGIIANGFWENNVRTGFELEDIYTGEKKILCLTNPIEGWEKFRRFYFNPEGFEFGNKVLNPANLAKADIIVIDEVGPFELEDKGWAQAIKSLLKINKKPMIWVVRENLTEDIITHFEIDDFNMFDINSSVSNTGRIVLNHCNGK